LIVTVLASSKRAADTEQCLEANASQRKHFTEAQREFDELEREWMEEFDDLKGGGVADPVPAFPLFHSYLGIPIRRLLRLWRGKSPHSRGNVMSPFQASSKKPGLMKGLGGSSRRICARLVLTKAMKWCICAGSINLPRRFAARRGKVAVSPVVDQMPLLVLDDQDWRRQKDARLLGDKAESLCS
jgi:hypothetical protein